MTATTDPILYNEDVIHDASAMFDRVQGRVTAKHQAEETAKEAAIALRREKLQVVCDILNDALSKRVLFEKNYFTGRIHPKMGEWWGDPRLNLLGAPNCGLPGSCPGEMLSISMLYPNCHNAPDRVNEVGTFYLYKSDRHHEFTTVRELVTFIFEYLSKRIIDGSVIDIDKTGQVDQLKDAR